MHPGKPMANMYFVLYGYSRFSSYAYGTWVNGPFSKDAVTQATLLLRDLKIGQCMSPGIILNSEVRYILTDAKLPPRASFTAQIIGTLLGAVLNYCKSLQSRFSHMCLQLSLVLMNSIIDNQREILLSIQGTNIWSGQQPQQYNSQAIAWGGLGRELFSVGKRYQWVVWSYLIGLAAPMPFWFIHRYWPKLRATLTQCS